MTSRVAVYYAPGQTDPLWAAGCAWLGRDAASGARTVQPALCGIEKITAAPRSYGFHATLKAPFRLREGIMRQDVLARAQGLAASIAPFPLPPLHVAPAGGFLALLATKPSAPLQALADTVVAGFDDLRAPLTRDELERRRAGGLSVAGEAMLARWGYPEVFEAWRFHMTLSQRLTEAQHAYYGRPAQAAFAPALSQQRQVSDICLFLQMHPGADFRIVQRIALGQNQGARLA